MNCCWQSINKVNELQCSKVEDHLTIKIKFINSVNVGEDVLMHILKYLD